MFIVDCDVDVDIASVVAMFIMLLLLLLKKDKRKKQGAADRLYVCTVRGPYRLYVYRSYSEQRSISNPTGVSRERPNSNTEETGAATRMKPGRVTDPLAL